jgi:hypothetical protein
MAIISTEENIKFTMSAHMAGGQNICNGTIYKKTSKAMLDNVVEVNIYDSSDIKKVYEITNADLREIALAAIGDNPKVGDSSELEIILPDEAMLMLSLDNRKNRDMSEIGEMAEVQIVGALSPEEREEMVDEMIKNDIRTIREDFYNDDFALFDAMLRGNSGWAQYSTLTDDEIRSEYAELQAELGIDSIFDQDEDQDEQNSEKIKL